MQRRTALALSALFMLPCLAGADTLPPSPPPQRAVLVTGASSGIGRKVTERLAAAGYFVYAARARTPTSRHSVRSRMSAAAPRRDQRRTSPPR